MLIGKRIKELRISKGLSQQELGDLLGVTKVSICGYENGTRTPGLDVFCALADIFETTTDYLLGREIAVINEEENEYVGSVSKEDIEILAELRRHTSLYTQVLNDPRRTISLINKKMNI